MRPLIPVALVAAAAAGQSVAATAASPRPFVITSATSPTEIRTLWADGSRARTLATGIQPAWAPDGRRIAFVELRAERDPVLAVIRDDGSRKRTVPLPRIKGENLTAMWPDWSPGGTRIAFVRALRRGIEPPYGLHVVSPGGSVLRTVYASRPGDWLEGPSWSPDGRHIAFSRTGTSIEVVTQRGHGRRTLYGGRSKGLSAGRPQWSPDGTRIAFDGADAVMVMNADGTAARKVADGRLPAWSPDGTRLAFIAPHNRLSIVSLATGSVRPLRRIRAVGVDWRR